LTNTKNAAKIKKFHIEIWCINVKEFFFYLGYFLIFTLLIFPALAADELPTIKKLWEIISLVPICLLFILQVLLYGVTKFERVEIEEDIVEPEESPTFSYGSVTVSD
jgi:hypothetical protein